ncbi:splicing factor U2af large subunit B-like isoform X1 [Rosa rugosa]|uniref:splicing factor U2af large subunit B-like isoform X1 n=1 Tax=Rosa rugosa TaxID=74645 RepID=UPI002B402DD9|nr:splicing factor U2af large subunit B-like isoform X1 [Rosa rugosa]
MVFTYLRSKAASSSSGFSEFPKLGFGPQNQATMSDYDGSKHKSHGSERESSWRERERGHDRERDDDRYSRDARDYKDRSGRFDRGRNKYSGYSGRRNQDYDRSRDYDQDRHRDYDQDRDRRHRHRSPSPSREEDRERSSRSRSKSKRASGFDMAPPAGAVLPTAAASGIPQSMPGVVQNVLPFGTAYPTLPMMPAQAMTQQATRHARRVYVGGLPPLANEQTIATFFSQVMAAIGGNSVGPVSELAGDAVVNVYINHEKKFAFVEMRTVEEASNAMALDGIIFEGVAVRVRRPTDYNPTLAAALGPNQPSPHLNLAAVGLTQGAVGGAEGPDRIFVGGLPYYFTEAQIRELLQSFGPLRGFDLVKDKDTGNSKGYGFCVYQDPAVTDIACGALNGLKMGDKTLTVRRATANSVQSKSEQENILVQAQQHIAMQKMAMQVVDMNRFGNGMASVVTTEMPTKVLCLTEAITADQLGDDEEYVEILEDMKDECSKFGTLLNVVIPRSNQDGEEISGVGKVFLEYSDTGSCANAKNVLGGRKFGGNIVNAYYYPEDKYSSKDYSA